MSNKKGLGKGLDTLISKDFDSSLLLDKSDRIQKIALLDIAPNPDQPRKSFDEQSIGQLAASIKQYGVLQPIIISAPANNKVDAKYIIVAGERRWRAAKIAGLTHIPAVVRDREELEQIEVSLIENVQREDLSPLEQAESIENLHQNFNYPYRKIAERLGKAEATISNIVRLLDLPPAARQALQEKQISEGHARAILALKDFPDKKEELLQLILQKHWSVREAERYVTAVKSGAKTNKEAAKRVSSELPEAKRLQKKLNTKITVKRTARGGRLELHFKDDKTLERLISLLQSIKD